MKFKQYINESNGNVSLSTILLMLYNNCLPYLKELHKAFPNNKKGNIFFLSGRSDSRDMFKKDIRTDRQPKDMPYEAHQGLDDAFQKEFGVYYRSESIFVIGNLNTADMYGDNVYMIFPTKNYSYIWSNTVSDLYSDSDDGNVFVDIDELSWDDQDDLTDEVNALLRDRWSERFGEPDSEGRWEYTNSGEENESDDAFGHQGESLEDFDERLSSDGYETYIDGFEWIPMYDEDEYIDDEFNDLYNEMNDQKIDEINDGVAGKIEEVVNSYTEGNYKAAIQSGNEIMLSGKSYIAIREDLYGVALGLWFGDHSYKDIDKYKKDLKSKNKEKAISKLQKWYDSKGQKMPRQLNLFDNM